MLRSLCLGLCLFGSFTAKPSAGTPVDYVVHSGYFEKNTSGLRGQVSYLIFDNVPAFDHVFGVAFTMGPKPNILKDQAFETRRVAALIKRGGETWQYEVQGVKEENGVLNIRYTSKSRDGGGARFASPLVVSVAKGRFRKVIFVENGQEVGKAELKARTDERPK